jgi:cyclopropane fatty-acyl-phospholipid synthase-like methyltransferase
MPADLPPFFDVLTFMTPLSESRADRLVDFVREGPTGTAVDIGCGWGELLLRVVDATPGSRGLGIDVDDESLAHASLLAADRGLGDRVEFRQVDLTAGERLSVEDCTAVLCIGSSHACTRDDPADPRMNYDGALRVVRELLPRGGRAVFGDGIWSRPPTAAAVANLGGLEDECLPLADVLDLAVAHGFAIEAAHEADLDEWDVFESGFAAVDNRWLAEHDPDHPEATDVRQRAREKRERYLLGYRGVLGLAYLQLVAI